MTDCWSNGLHAVEEERPAPQKELVLALGWDSWEIRQWKKKIKKRQEMVQRPI